MSDNGTSPGIACEVLPRAAARPASSTHRRMTAVLPTGSSVPALSDAELMVRVQHDDAAAFSELYDRHAARAYRVARAVCRGAGSTEEAVQEGFMAIWKHRMSYDPGRGSVVTWAMTVVRHRAIDVARHDGVHDRRRSDAEHLNRRVACEDTASDALAADRAQYLRTLLAELPALQREVITLAFYGELTHTEIAAHLALPAGTVKGRMRLGLEKLSARLAA